jgi:hypothetical protein
MISPLVLTVRTRWTGASRRRRSRSGRSRHSPSTRGNGPDTLPDRCLSLRGGQRSGVWDLAFGASVRGFPRSIAQPRLRRSRLGCGWDRASQRCGARPQRRHAIPARLSTFGVPRARSLRGCSNRRRHKGHRVRPPSCPYRSAGVQGIRPRGPFEHRPGSTVTLGGSVERRVPVPLASLLRT